MRPDIQALLRPLVRTVALLLALALGVGACLLVLMVIVRGSHAEAFPACVYRKLRLGCSGDAVHRGEHVT